MADPVLTIVISYDIVRPRARRRVAALLEDRMTRVQQSVFEARLKATAANRLFDRVVMEIDDEDSVRMYVLSKTGLEQSRVTGGAPLPEEGGFWLL